jgi:hypothetical protein
MGKEQSSFMLAEDAKRNRDEIREWPVAFINVSDARPWFYSISPATL